MIPVREVAAAEVRDAIIRLNDSGDVEEMAQSIISIVTEARPELKGPIPIWVEFDGCKAAWSIGIEDQSLPPVALGAHAPTYCLYVDENNSWRARPTML